MRAAATFGEDRGRPASIRSRIGLVAPWRFLQLRAAMPTVFISHSCKDHEQVPPPGLSALEAAARAERLAFARKLRDTLHARLKKNKRYEVFLDVRGGLQAGDIWQDGLHSALRTCAAGVVLLTPESLESGWVLKEATILSWRVFERQAVILVPVVLGVPADELARRGFGALALDQIQWVRVTGTDDAALASAVTEIVKSLDRIPPSPLAADKVLPPTERWIEAFAQDLRTATGTDSQKLTADYLVNMCRALEIHPEQRARFDRDPHINLAAQALLASQHQIVDFLKEAGDPKPPLRESLRKAVAALWVDPVPASRLASGGSVIAIDAEESSSAREYILRAFCNRIDPEHIIEPGDVTNGADADVIAAVEDALGVYFDVDDPAALASEVARRGPIFVILGPGSVRPTVLDAITAKYPQITVVTAAGLRPSDRLGRWWDPARLLYPLLQPKREAAATRFRNKLQAFVNG
jgi:TIR domain